MCAPLFLPCTTSSARQLKADKARLRGAPAEPAEQLAVVDLRQSQAPSICLSALLEQLLVGHTTEDVLVGIDTMVGQLSDYDFERHELCPSRDFGIPTRRRRSYWVGKLKAARG